MNKYSNWLYPRWESNSQTLHPKCSGFTNICLPGLSTPDRIQTCDTYLRRVVLYSAELLEHTLLYSRDLNNIKLLIKLLSNRQSHKDIIIPTMSKLISYFPYNEYKGKYNFWHMQIFWQLFLKYLNFVKWSLQN